ncbi:MAG TPA: fatty acid desaturase [Acetobacteraceae bacterium]|nr:fatty acid desaturase [Acetobacteraceae bacterium]
MLAPTELHALSRRANLPGALRLGVRATLLLGTEGWLAVAGPWTVVPAFLTFGLIQVALFAPAHEMMHQTAFASRRVNAIFGRLAACPSLLNLHFYTSFHLAHHRNTQIPGEDPELDLAPTDNVRGYVWRVLGIPYWRLRLRVIRDCCRGDLGAYPYVTAKATPGVITSVRVMSAVMVGGALASALAFGWRAPLLFWIGPQLLCQPFLRAYVLAEHIGCAEHRNGLTNTRTTLTNMAVRLLMWNIPYHAEHHLYPSIPFHRLADAHAALRTRLGFVQPGYARWHLGLLRQLRG